jgi:hypothetical protein
MREPMPIPGPARVPKGRSGGGRGDRLRALDNMAECELRHAIPRYWVSTKPHVTSKLSEPR